MDRQHASRHTEPARAPSPVRFSCEDFAGLIKNRSPEERDERATRLAERKGLNPELFCKAFSLAQHAIEASRREDMLPILARRNYELLQQLFAEPRNDVARELISRHLLDGVVFDESRLADYSMKAVVTAHRSYKGRPSLDPTNLADVHGDKSGPFMDAPFGFTLNYRGVENAIVTMWPDKRDPDTLLIRQIQGVQKRLLGTDNRTVVKRQHSRGLNGFEWGDVLVEYATILARALGYQKIAIESAHNLYWTGRDDEGRMHMPLEKGLQCYDQRAARLGFVQQTPAERGIRPDWEKSLL